MAPHSGVGGGTPMPRKLRPEVSWTDAPGGDPERGAGAVHDARQEISPELVAAQWTRPARRLEGLAQVELDRIERQGAGAQRRDHGHGEEPCAAERENLPAARPADA